MSTNLTIGTADSEFTVAIRRTTYSLPDGGPDIGFDLDDTCTGEGQGSSCRLPSWAADPTDAASWAFNFEADSAVLTDEVEPTRVADFHICPPETRPANDHCY